MMWSRASAGRGVPAAAGETRIVADTTTQAKLVRIATLCAVVHLPRRRPRRSTRRVVTVVAGDRRVTSLRNGGVPCHRIAIRCRFSP